MTVARAQLHGRLREALDRTVSRLRAMQRVDGAWALTLETDASATALSLLARRYLGRPNPDLEAGAVRYFRSEQGDGGGWSAHPAGPAVLDPTVLVYVAMRAAGVPPADPDLVRARSLIRRLGGLPRVCLGARLFLAVSGIVPRRLLPRAPLPLLATRGGLGMLDRLGVAGIVVAAGSLLARSGTVRSLPAERRPAELLRGIDRWRFRTPWQPISAVEPAGRPRRDAARRASAAPSSLTGLAWWITRTVTLLSRSVDAVVSGEAAERRIRAWIASRQDEEGSFAGMLPTSLLALLALDTGGPGHGRRVNAGLARLDDWLVRDERGIWQQYAPPRISDTAFAGLLLGEAEATPDDPALVRARRWLVARCSGDPTSASGAGCGWYFADARGGYPECDTTSSVLRMLAATGEVDDEDLRAGTRWLLSMQNDDGGWPVWCRSQRRLAFFGLEAATRALQDRSEVDVTCRVLLFLSGSSAERDRHGPGLRRAIRRGLRFVRRAQADDGSWYGRWNRGGAYGTAEALEALASCGEAETGAVRRGIERLLELQNEDGGWGGAGRASGAAAPGIAASDPFTTGAVVRTLTRWRAVPRNALDAGVSYLLEAQRPDGLWPDSTWVGVAVPDVSYLRYELMPTCAAGIAIARYLRRVRALTPRGPGRSASGTGCGA